MKKKRNNRGFTMAELLIVVGIIAVLAGVGFIAVQSYQKSMAQLEADAIAKEIFIAAQNHLTMAESQGYTSATMTINYGNAATIKQSAESDNTDASVENAAAQNVYYFNVPAKTDKDSFTDSVLGLMLPFGSIDETIRAGGNYVILYQANPARVLDVFYGSKTGRYKADPTTGTFDRDALYQTSKNHSDGTVIGWYGGADTQESGVQLNAPVITVENAERLTVTVDATKVNVDDTKTETDKSIIGATDLSLKLIITNANETAMAAIPLDVYASSGVSPLSTRHDRVSEVNTTAVAAGTPGSTVGPVSNGKVYSVVLDDITTADMHFADINGDATIDKLKNGVPFKPGEDIIVYAVAYSNTTLCSIVYSNAITVNSLFADCHEDENATNKPLTAYIANFRHLENLDGAVSGLRYTGEDDSWGTVDVVAAQQIEDLGEITSTASAVVTPTTAPTTTPTASPAATTTPGSSADAPKDLSWTGFVEAIKAANKTATVSSVQVYTLAKTGETQTATEDGKYRPVSPSYALTYKGGYDVVEGTKNVHKAHTITNVSANETGAAGLFGAPTGALTVSDLVLYDFEISGSDAGALAGTLPAGSSVTNVLAYHGETAKTVTATGNAGGLIGSFTVDSDANDSDASDLSTVTNSAAAMLVSSTGTIATVSAGGLIGMIDLAANVTVTDSYSGGHTTAKKYDTSSPEKYNITAASGNAGGLIGAVSKTTSEAPGTINVNYCYSTCSASGNVAGGLIGTVDASGDVSVSYSYAVGKTSGNDALVGSGTLSGRTITDFDFVHGVDMDNEDLLMPETLKTGEGADPTWKKRAETAPYDTALSGKNYPFPTVNQLHYIETTKKNEAYTEPTTQPVQLTTHYGDWEEITLLADADLALINAERLSAKITLPKEQIADGGVVTMLIRGESSHPIVDATNDAYDAEKDVLLVLKVTKSDASNNTVYALSLSPESNVPGRVESEDLQVWFNKLKKAGVGVKVPASDDATQTNAEIELNLDDITAADKHFAQLFPKFIPGENISVAVKGGVVTTDKLNAMVKAVMTDTTKNSSTETDNSDPDHPVTRTVAARTNSLFADPKTDDYGDGTDVNIATTASASIANFRHLENLDNAISGVNADEYTTTLKYTSAKQIVDLSNTEATEDQPGALLGWYGFIEKVYKNGTYLTEIDDTSIQVKIYKIADTSAGTEECNLFLPVNTFITGTGGHINYDGQGHSISDVHVNIADNAGLFGTLPEGCKVSNLELIDFDITSTSGNAGALAGASNSAEITNVLARNSTSDMDPTVTAASNAGGLVGYMTGGKVEQSAAALVVSSTGGSAGGNAGGLIGNVTSGTVSGSYSGGHTSGGAYDDGHFNVIATGTAGGLIGAVSGSVTVDCCYSTCSASGTAAGSLIGASVNTVAVSHSYAVGKTSGTAQTFLGSGSVLVTVDDTQVAKTKEDLEFVYAVDMDNDDLSVTTKTDAEPYDSALINAPTSKKYPYPTVTQLRHMADSTYSAPTNLPVHVGTHYGDWGPIPQLDVNLELINRERLSAKITLPAAQIADGGKLTMLIHGDTNTTTDAEAKDALLVFKVTTSKDTGGTTTYALSLSSESTVPGVTDMAAWFVKVKKTEAGIATATVEDDATVEIELNLDDITAAGKHFTNLFPQFTPGENITAAVKGGVIAQTKLETIVAGVETDWKVSKEGTEYVIAARTNSLFADPKTTTYPNGTDLTATTGASVSIANFRHLENLDNAISGATFSITKAVQIANLSEGQTYPDGSAANLSWTGFVSAVAKKDNEGTQQKIKVYKHTDAEDTTGTTGDDYFLPVNPAAIEYDGQGHSITGVVVNTAGEAGLFGALISGSTVKNLELIDFDITATSGNAGALAGTLNSVTVENILVHDSGEDGKTTAVASNSGSAGGLIGTMTDSSVTNALVYGSSATVNATGSAGGLIGTMTDSSVTNALVYGSSATVNATGSAGGLIGSMSGASTKVKYCAAALVVNSSGGDAGGLIGAATGGEVSGSYSGGHTTNGEYTAFNVTAAGSAGNAGGLIGDASGVTKVENCYSTCSATGSTAGGLVGTASGTFTNCYATGLVQGTTESAKVGAFAGSFSGSTDAKKPCLYFEAVNSGMAAIGDNTTGVTIRELDENLIKYKEFVGTTWTDAKPYDEKLKTDYEDKVNNGKYLYNLKGMTRLDASMPATNFVATHYGDWPMPGILVNNTKNGG